MKAVEHANQALTFFLELAVYASVIGWSFRSSSSTTVKVIVAVAGVAVLAVTWGLFAAPKASMPLHGAALVAFEIAWFSVGVAACWSSGLRRWAVVLAVLLAVNGALRAAFATS
jgi:hypothetical protein